MLHEETINSQTLELLKKLSKESYISEFALAGGTALSLYFGHRKSIDLDFFTSKEFNSSILHTSLLKSGYKLTEKYIPESGNTVNCNISGISVQFLSHLYEQLKPANEIDGIRLYSIEDIAAMKINAICNRGAKKDFWDINELLEKNDLSDLIKNFKDKYGIEDIKYVLNSLIYFSDAEKQPDPAVIKRVTWLEVKNNIKKCVNNYVDKKINELNSSRKCNFLI